jgi:uncharacterized protein (TIGR02246 family)
MKLIALISLLMMPVLAQDTALAARVKALEDRMEIERVLLNYGRFLDARQLANYAGLFAKDGEWTGGFGTVKGQKAIQEFMEKNIGTAPNRAGTHHILTNFAIDVAGDKATAWSRWMFVVATADGKPNPSQSGHYEDKLVREDGKWKFAQRIAFTDIPHNDPTEKK